MLFRAMSEQDVDFVKDHSISRGIFSKTRRCLEWSYCLEDNGIVLGIGGVSLINDTTAWGWLDMTEYAKEQLLICYRVLVEWMDRLCKDKQIKRLQAYVETDFPEAIRLVEHLGFHKESTMPNFVGDKPAFLYVKFFDGVCDEI